MTLEFGGNEFWIRFAIASLATWRITHLLAYEDGPGDVIHKLRTLAGHGFWGRLLDCFYCLSLWAAAPLSPLVVRHPTELVVVWVALSGAACLLERATAPSIQIERPHGSSAEMPLPEGAMQEE